MVRLGMLKSAQGRGQSETETPTKPKTPSHNTEEQAQLSTLMERLKEEG